MTQTAHAFDDNPVLAGWRDRLATTTSQARVVFAEGDDPRVRRAANELIHYGVQPLVICDPKQADPTAEPTVELSASVETATVATLVAGRSGERVEAEGVHRGWAASLGEERRRSPLYLAAALVDIGSADAAVGGSTRPSGDVIRAGLHMIGLEPDSGLLSSSFLLRMPSGQLMSFGDCAVVPEPDTLQLADIAISTARTFENLTGETAAVAMLSFSTKGSADHPAVQLVRDATSLVRKRAPDLAVDGELQFDAALLTSVGRRKAAGSTVAGHANVFIFPNLSAGNIGYKIAQRFGGAQAYGPIIQGLQAPMNDLSRGCSVGDIVSVALISALRAAV